MNDVSCCWNQTVAIHVFIDNKLSEVLEANLTRSDLHGKTPCGTRPHGFVGRLPGSVWKGQHTLTVFALNPAPNARASNATLIQLGGLDRLCNGVSCGAERDDISTWSQEQLMRAIL